MKQLLVFLFLLCAASVSAQDVIVKKDGSTIVCRVMELTATEITYKKWSDLNGSNYVMDRSLASAINYENGKREEFSSVQSQYLPGNQNDGVQQYNDKALLGMDFTVNRVDKKYRTIGWIGGGTLVTLGSICLIAFNDKLVDYTYETNYLGIIGGCTLITAGVGWTSYCLIKANRIKKESQPLLSSTILQYDFSLTNGSTLSAGIDLLTDRTEAGRTFGSNTLGLGLRYNF